MFDVTRRAMLASTFVAGAGVASAATGSLTADGASNPAMLRLFKSTDGVNLPPKGAGKMKFSFSSPEPSVEFGGLFFAFEVVTFENNYSVDPASVSVERSGDALRLTATRLRWAGGQEMRDGQLSAQLRRTADGAIEWEVSASLDVPVKSLKTIIRGVPRGRISTAAEQWRDIGEDEFVCEYPALLGGMATPFVAIDGKDGRCWGISALQTEVRPARFALFPGAEGYKVELIYEQAGWDRKGDVRSCTWRLMPARDFATAAGAHFAAVQRNWNLPAFTERADAPAWMKQLALVVSLHGEHWTGYIYNDFARQLEILRWIAKQIDPKTVMIFLAGWDGRYYWDYPQFEVGERLGGAAAFERLIREGRKLGFRFAMMFGSNIANPDGPGFDKIADARIHSIYRDPFPGDYVDWDGDRKGDGSMVFMNLAVSSWRNHLADRISTMIKRYPVDAYFLDICGLWENNLSGDMLLGVKQLVETLAQRLPGVPAIAEMHIDAQMGFIPMNQVSRYPLYPQANFDVVASFHHLSWPAPGRGSTGVHEYGFNQYRPVTLDQPQIPTITFVDDTFSDQREAVMRDVATAKQRFAKRGART